MQQFQIVQQHVMQQAPQTGLIRSQVMSQRIIQQAAPPWRQVVTYMYIAMFRTFYYYLTKSHSIIGDIYKVITTKLTL